MTSALGRLLTIRRRSAIVVAVSSIPAYLVAWDLDPWVFGILVLGLWPLQAAVALSDVAARLTRHEPIKAFVPWIVDVALIAMAAGSLAFVRTISWA